MRTTASPQTLRRSTTQAHGMRETRIPGWKLIAMHSQMANITAVAPSVSESITRGAVITRNIIVANWISSLEGRNGRIRSPWAWRSSASIRLESNLHQTSIKAHRARLVLERIRGLDAVLIRA